MRQLQVAAIVPRIAAIGLVFFGLGLVPAAAQQAVGVNPGRDCQTVRTCNFSRGAAVRGCLSSYTCRTCRTVSSRCSVGGAYTRCQQIVCTWGG